MPVWVSCCCCLEIAPTAQCLCINNGVRLLFFRCVCVYPSIYTCAWIWLNYIDSVYASKVFQLPLLNSMDICARVFVARIHRRVWTHTHIDSTHINETMFTICFSYYLILSTIRWLLNLFSVSCFLSPLSQSKLHTYIVYSVHNVSTDCSNWSLVSITRGS